MINKTTITRKKKKKPEEKQLYGYFKRLTSGFLHEKSLIWQRKGKHKRKAESLLIAAQNNANYNKANIDKMLQNSKYRLYGDRDETIYYIISEYCKLA